MLDDLPDFTLDLDEQPSEAKMPVREAKAYQKYKRIVTERVSSLNIDFEAIAEGHQLRLITDMAINALVVLEKIGQRYEIEEAHICVYRMNQRSVNWIKEHLHDAGIQATVLLSNFFRENKRYEAWFNNILALKSDKFIVKTGCLHAKVFCCRTACGKHFVFEGSGNLSDNARLEQYIFEQSKQTFDFHKGWMADYGN